MLLCRELPLEISLSASVGLLGPSIQLFLKVLFFRPCLFLRLADPRQVACHLQSQKRGWSAAGLLELGCRKQEGGEKSQHERVYVLGLCWWCLDFFRSVQNRKTPRKAHLQDRRQVPVSGQSKAASERTLSFPGKGHSRVRVPRELCAMPE